MYVCMYGHMPVRFALADRFYGLLSVTLSLVGTDFDLLMCCLLPFLLYVHYFCDIRVCLYVHTYLIFAPRFKSLLVSKFFSFYFF